VCFKAVRVSSRFRSTPRRLVRHPGQITGWTARFVTTDQTIGSLAGNSTEQREIAAPARAPSRDGMRWMTSAGHSEIPLRSRRPRGPTALQIAFGRRTL